MKTTQPTARPAEALLELADGSFEMLFPRLIFFDGDNPTNPLIPGKWGKIIPGR